jgi:hypothetical protein
VPQLRRLAAHFSPLGYGSVPGTFRRGSAVDKVELRQISFRVLWFYPMSCAICRTDKGSVTGHTYAEILRHPTVTIKGVSYFYNREMEHLIQISCGCRVFYVARKNLYQQKSHISVINNNRLKIMCIEGIFAYFKIIFQH